MEVRNTSSLQRMGSSESTDSGIFITFYGYICALVCLDQKASELPLQAIVSYLIRCWELNLFSTGAPSTINH